MKIKIVAQNVMVKGLKRIRVRQIEMLSWEDLPAQYTEQKGSVWLDGTLYAVLNTGGRKRDIMTVGLYYSPGEFREILRKIRIASGLLADTRKKMRGTHDEWEREVIFEL